jgi:hypothetical protein
VERRVGFGIVPGQLSLQCFPAFIFYRREDEKLGIYTTLLLKNKSSVFVKGGLA